MQYYPKKANLFLQQSFFSFVLNPSTLSVSYLTLCVHYMLAVGPVDCNSNDACHRHGQCYTDVFGNSFCNCRYPWTGPHCDVCKFYVCFQNLGCCSSFILLIMHASCLCFLIISFLLYFKFIYFLLYFFMLNVLLCSITILISDWIDLQGSYALRHIHTLHHLHHNIDFGLCTPRQILMS